MDKVELLPCPFCGGEAKLFARRCAEDAECASVECRQCHCSTDLFEDAFAPRDEAIAAWNTRHQAERLAAQPSIPHGWKLVPVEPTEEMASAGADELFESVGQDWNEDACCTWSAMLAAAPTPPDVAS